jgi:hypothetical protein
MSRHAVGSVKICPAFALDLWRKVLPLPLLMAKSHKPGASQKPSIHAGGNNLTTTREVYAGQSKSAPLGSPTPTGVVSVGAETAPSTGRPNVPGLVPNPQPIPFPSKAELEKQGYRFGPFTPQHNPLDVEMIAHYARRGYRPLQPHEIDYAEFQSNGVPFALAARVPYRPPTPSEH